MARPAPPAPARKTPNRFELIPGRPICEHLRTIVSRRAERRRPFGRLRGHKCSRIPLLDITRPLENMTTPERLTAKTRPRRGGSIKLLATLGAAAGLTMPVQAERKVFILAGQWVQDKKVKMV